MRLGPHLQEAALGVRAWVNELVDKRWDNDPFGREPHASKDEYYELFEQTRRKDYPAIDEIETELGYRVDRAWLDQLALHTQIVKKNSDLGYPHGRLLYSLLRWMIAERSLEFLTILETGTARGFSAVCMAKALADSGVDGRIITLDVLSHLKPQIWNCVDDHDGPKSRAGILAPWSELTRKIMFLQGDTLYSLPRLGLERIHFAFLDAQHIESSVLHEYSVVSARQWSGDIVVFDDVTTAVFPGVVAAVNKIQARGEYMVRRLEVSEQRAFAWARRK